MKYKRQRERGMANISACINPLRHKCPQRKRRCRKGHGKDTANKSKITKLKRFPTGTVRAAPI